MTIMLADGDGLGGGRESFDESDEIGRFSLDHGIDGFEDIWKTGQLCLCNLGKDACLE